MYLNKRTNKRLSFWSHFSKLNLAVPRSLGLKCKKKSWKRFSFSSAFWKKKALSPFKLSEIALNYFRVKDLLKVYLLS